eukprot:Ihof_evm3s10 gene=Ihof_evmTU3s10
MTHRIIRVRPTGFPQFLPSAFSGLPIETKIHISTRKLGTHAQHRLDTFKRFYQDRLKDFLPCPSFRILLEDKVLESTDLGWPGSMNTLTPMMILKKIYRSILKDALCVRLNDTLWDLKRPLWQVLSLHTNQTDRPNIRMKVIRLDDPDGPFVFANASAHVLGCALEGLYDDSILLDDWAPIKGGIGNQFLYNIYLKDGTLINSADLQQVSRKTRDIIKGNRPFHRIDINQLQARELFAYNPNILSTINQATDNVMFSAYCLGDTVCLSQGPMLMSAGQIKAMQLSSVQEGPTKGTLSNYKLQTVKGVAFDNNNQVDDWRKKQIEVEARNHRVIGTKQGLFMSHPYSPGSPFFLPHGMRIVNKLLALIRKEYMIDGYDEVGTPSIYNKELWETSGHWEMFKNDMFMVIGGANHIGEEADMGLKPMNCPGHCLIFDHTEHSYKDLPIRLADFSCLHRKELGSVSGLTRVCKFHQDDAHIFCRRDQIETEVTNCIAMLNRIYTIFGFQYSFALSTKPDNFIGDANQWDEAQITLLKCLKNTGKSFSVHEKDGAFYGPKIDVTIQNALGDVWQTATIQLDFQLPQRFNLHYTDAQSKRDTPVIIHRAILGSVERMLALLCEHTAGKWPLWLSPRQVLVVPVAITPELIKYCDDVNSLIRTAGFYSDKGSMEETMQKNIRNGQLLQYNYIVVVGEKEQSTGHVNI